MFVRLFPTACETKAMTKQFITIAPGWSHWQTFFVKSTSPAPSWSVENKSNGENVFVDVMHHPNYWSHDSCACSCFCIWQHRSSTAGKWITLHSLWVLGAQQRVEEVSTRPLHMHHDFWTNAAWRVQMKPDLSPRVQLGLPEKGLVHRVCSARCCALCGLISPVETGRVCCWHLTWMGTKM